MKFRSLLLALFLISPLFSYAASVFINEVAWMGTTASASDEWIELYNAGSTDVDISGWTLALFKPASTTPTKIIALSGSIATDSYYLIERTDDSTVSNITADLVNSFGSLIDSGMIIRLFDTAGQMIDTTPEPCASTWCAGTNNPKITMERIDRSLPGSLATAWATNSEVKRNGSDAAGNTIAGTPKTANSSGNTNTETPTVSSTNGETISDDQPSKDLAPSSTIPKFTVFAGDDQTVIAGAETLFLGRVLGFDGKPLDGGRFLWNFGDGATAEGRAVGHIFRFPGVYHVSLTVSSESDSAADYLIVNAVPSPIFISEIAFGADAFVELANDSVNALDIGAWIIKNESSGAEFTLPMSTTITSRGAVAISDEISRLGTSGMQRSSIALFYPNRKLATRVILDRDISLGSSFQRGPDGVWRVSSHPTPGIIEKESKVVLSVGSSLPKTAPVPIEKPADADGGNASSSLEGMAIHHDERAVDEKFATIGFSSRIYFGLALFTSLLASLGFFAARKFFIS